MLKIIFPHGGWGLGNDLIPWCKAYILSKKLKGEAIILGPAWGNNRRGYGRYFRSFPYDYLSYRAVLKLLPKIPFAESIFRESGGKSFSTACEAFIDKHQIHQRRAYAVTITGIWGAFPGIVEAKDFATATLLNTRFTPDHLFHLAGRVDRSRLTVGIHVRLGDFAAANTLPTTMPAGMNDARLPHAWYLNVLRQLAHAIGENALQCFVCSDGTEAEIADLLVGDNAVFCSSAPNTDISDLIMLSKCDLLICSTSTYSAWAAFLSTAPYVWFGERTSKGVSAPALDQYRALGVQMPEFDDHDGRGRGHLVGQNGALPDRLLDRLRVRLNEKRALL